MDVYIGDKSYMAPDFMFSTTTVPAYAAPTTSSPCSHSRVANAVYLLAHELKRHRGVSPSRIRLNGNDLSLPHIQHMRILRTAKKHAFENIKKKRARLTARSNCPRTARGKYVYTIQIAGPTLQGTFTPIKASDPNIRQQKKSLDGIMGLSCPHVLTRQQSLALCT